MNSKDLKDECCWCKFALVVLVILTGISLYPAFRWLVGMLMPEWLALFPWLFCQLLAIRWMLGWFK